MVAHLNQCLWYSFPLISCRHCSLIASTSLRLEQMITVLVRSTAATSTTFQYRIIPSLIFNSTELSVASLALTISFNCNMLKFNHVKNICRGSCAGSPNGVLPMVYIYHLSWCIFYIAAQLLEKFLHWSLQIHRSVFFSNTVSTVTFQMSSYLWWETMNGCTLN